MRWNYERNFWKQFGMVDFLVHRIDVYCEVTKSSKRPELTKSYWQSHALCTEMCLWDYTHMAWNSPAFSSHLLIMRAIEDQYFSWGILFYGILPDWYEKNKREGELMNIFHLLPELNLLFITVKGRWHFPSGSTYAMRRRKRLEPTPMRAPLHLLLIAIGQLWPSTARIYLWQEKGKIDTTIWMSLCYIQTSYFHYCVNSFAYCQS